MGLAALALLATSCGSSDNSDAPDALGDSTAFFTQTAAGGGLDATTLTLAGVAPSVIAVLDRPLRTVEHIPVASFVDTFTERFAGDLPNAILTAVVGDEEQTAVFTISEPTYTSDTRTVTFTVVNSDGSNVTLPQFGLATLTIDSGPSEVSSQYTKLGVTQGNSDATLDLRDEQNISVSVERDSEGQLVLTSEERQLGGYMKISNNTDAAIEATVTREDGSNHTYRIARSGSLLLRT